MKKRTLSDRNLEQFSLHLLEEEKSTATCEKYLRDVRQFRKFAGKKAVEKELVIAWKRQLQERGYAVRSINSMLASVNSLLRFLNWQDCKVKNIRLQRQTYCPEEKELTKAEYLRLIEASERDRQLNLVIQTICATGIRVSELQYFTVEALHRGAVTVNCKAKTRTIFIPGKLKKQLLKYARQEKIASGSVFLGKKKKPLDRSMIWRRMKALCKVAGVAETKVFPHNLRKLFAFTFYHYEKDIAKLADILGHSSINTTRIYIMSTGVEHRKKIEKLGLVV